MVFGCAWDQVCKFISTAKDANGDLINLTDPKKYGNCMDSEFPANTGNYNRSIIQRTGSNEAWKTNNIYDLAGNGEEWTQECYLNLYGNGTYARALRGGCCYATDGVGRPVTHRNYGSPTSSGYAIRNITTRPIIYLK